MLFLNQQLNRRKLFFSYNSKLSNIRFHKFPYSIYFEICEMQTCAQFGLILSDLLHAKLVWLPVVFLQYKLLIAPFEFCVFESF